MARKVFQAHLGFYDTIVASPSQTSALAAWGSTQNLFRIGLARLAEDPGAIKAAMAKPGIVLRRPAGTNVPFSEDPPLPSMPKSVKPPRAAAPPKQTAAPAKQTAPRKKKPSRAAPGKTQPSRA